MSSMEKGGELELLALLSTVLGISWKESEQRKQLAKPCSYRAIKNQLPPGSTYYLISIKAGPAAFYRLQPF